MNHCSRAAAQTFANVSSVEIIRTSAVELIHVVPADQSAMTSKETEYKVHEVSNIHRDIPQPVGYFFNVIRAICIRTQSSPFFTSLNVCNISLGCFFQYEAKLFTTFTILNTTLS